MTHHNQTKELTTWFLNWFFSLSFGVFQGLFLIVLDVDLSSLFIVGELPDRV
jgi:hypothetical protein